MKLILSHQHRKLLRQGRASSAALARGEDFPEQKPVVKLFTPDAACTWLLTELDPEDPDIAFGLCDLGLGSPELGNVRLSELAALRGQLGLSVERDRHFDPPYTLTVYVRAAQRARRITEDRKMLADAADHLAHEWAENGIEV